MEPGEGRCCHRPPASWFERLFPVAGRIIAIDFLELCIDDGFLITGIATLGIARRLFGLIGGFAHLHHRLRQLGRFRGYGLDIVTLEGLLQRRDPRLNLGLCCRVGLVTKIGDGLLGTMDKRLALIAFLNGVTALLVFLGKKNLLSPYPVVKSFSTSTYENSFPTTHAIFTIGVSRTAAVTSDVSYLKPVTTSTGIPLNSVSKSA
jgi:hypothetical protein